MSGFGSEGDLKFLGINRVECPTTRRVIDKMRDRANEGMKKFGVTMPEREDYNPIRLLMEAQEEALGLAIYLEELIDRLTLNGKYLEWRNRDKLYILPTH